MNSTGRADLDIRARETCLAWPFWLKHFGFDRTGTEAVRASSAWYFSFHSVRRVGYVCSRRLLDDVGFSVLVGQVCLCWKLGLRRVSPLVCLDRVSAKVVSLAWERLEWTVGDPARSRGCCLTSAPRAGSTRRSRRLCRWARSWFSGSRCCRYKELLV